MKVTDVPMPEHARAARLRAAQGEADGLLTVKQVAQRLHVSEAWVFAHASGRVHPYLPSIKLGRSVRFRAADIEQFIEHCRRCIEKGIAIQ